MRGTAVQAAQFQQAALRVEPIGHPHDTVGSYILPHIGR